MAHKYGPQPASMGDKEFRAKMAARAKPGVSAAASTLRAAKGMKLGQGGRFQKLEGQLAAKGAKNPGALAAYIGRKKLGAAKFNKLSAKGRKRAS